VPTRALTQHSISATSGLREPAQSVCRTKVGLVPTRALTHHSISATSGLRQPAQSVCRTKVGLVPNTGPHSALHFSYLWPTSTSPKSLSLTKFTSNNIRVNRAARVLLRWRLRENMDGVTALVWLPTSPARHTGHLCLHQNV
jgi:hypothetical protein